MDLKMGGAEVEIWKQVLDYESKLSYVNDTIVFKIYEKLIAKLDLNMTGDWKLQIAILLADSYQKSPFSLLISSKMMEMWAREAYFWNQFERSVWRKRIPGKAETAMHILVDFGGFMCELVSTR